MPIFDYHCDNCDKDFDEFAHHNREVIKCPTCAKEAKIFDFTVPKNIRAKFIGTGFACVDMPRTDNNFRVPPYMPDADEVARHNINYPEDQIVPTSF